MSVALDPAADQQVAKLENSIQSPMAVDADRSVSAAYDVLQWAIASGEPGHTFVLVDKDGRIAWIRDYGAPDLADRTMYVPLADLVAQVEAALKSS